MFKGKSRLGSLLWACLAVPAVIVAFLEICLVGWLLYQLFRGLR